MSRPSTRSSGYLRLNNSNHRLLLTVSAPASTQESRLVTVKKAQTRMDLPKYVMPPTFLIDSRSSFSVCLLKDSPSSSETMDAFISPEALVQVRQIVCASTSISAYQRFFNLLHRRVQHLFRELSVGCREPLKLSSGEPLWHISYWMNRLLAVLQPSDTGPRTERYEIHKERPRLCRGVGQLNHLFGSCNVWIGHAGDLNTIHNIHDRCSYSPGGRIRNVASNEYGGHTLSRRPPARLNDPQAF